MIIRHSAQSNGPSTRDVSLKEIDGNSHNPLSFPPFLPTPHQLRSALIFASFNVTCVCFISDFTHLKGFVHGFFFHVQDGLLSSIKPRVIFLLNKFFRQYILTTFLSLPTPPRSSRF